MPTDICFSLLENPWPITIGDAVLEQILCDAFVERARGIEEMLTNQARWLSKTPPDPPSFAFCVMNPTAPISTASEDCILALAWLGPEGKKYLPNAIAKAFDIRDKNGRAHVQNPDNSHLFADGSFRWEGGVRYYGLIVGGSGLSVGQDRQQNFLLAKDLVEAVARAHDEWGNEHLLEEGWSWFSEKPKLPAGRFRPEMYLGRKKSIELTT